MLQPFSYISEMYTENGKTVQLTVYIQVGAWPGATTTWTLLDNY